MCSERVAYKRCIVLSSRSQLVVSKECDVSKGFVIPSSTSRKGRDSRNNPGKYEEVPMTSARSINDPVQDDVGRKKGARKK